MRDSQEIVLSNAHKVKVKDLTAKEAMRADTAAGRDGSPAVVRAVGAISEFDGETMVGPYTLPLLAGPVDQLKAGVDCVLDKFDQREYETLVSRYSELYILDDAGLEKLKNSQAAQS